MCVLCIEYMKGKMTRKEAYQALPEVIADVPLEHISEIYALIEDKDKDQKDKL